MRVHVHVFQHSINPNCFGKIIPILQNTCALDNLQEKLDQWSMTIISVRLLLDPWKEGGASACMCNDLQVDPYIRAHKITPDERLR